MQHLDDRVGVVRDDDQSHANGRDRDGGRANGRDLTWYKVS